MSYTTFTLINDVAGPGQKMVYGKKYKHKLYFQDGLFYSCHTSRIMKCNGLKKEQLKGELFEHNGAPE